MEFNQSTDFRVNTLTVDGTDIRSMFFSTELYENIYIQAVTGTVIVVDTSSNQLLAKKQLEGNEEIEFEAETPKGKVTFKGFINRIADKMMDGNGNTIYTFEVASPVVRANEMSMMSRSFRNAKPKDVIEKCLDKLNQQSDIPIKKDMLMGDGLAMHFVTGTWHPMRVINFVQRKGVPMGMRRGDSTASEDIEPREAQGKGLGGFLFWDTLKGVRFGSDEEVMTGKVGTEVSDRFEFRLANRGEDLDTTSRMILDFNVPQNNDTQTQTRSGAFKSKLISFDMDKLHYKEQEWESELATDKQKKTSKEPTRVMSRMYVNEQWENKCDRAQHMKYDQSRKYLQQEQGTHTNVTDGMSCFTFPVRADINAGDKVDTIVYEVNTDSAAKHDKKFSGNWIISGVAHHFRLENKAAHTRVTCLRAPKQTDEYSSYTL